MRVLRTGAATLLAGVVGLAGAPVPATASNIAISLVAVGDTTLPQGRPFKLKAIVENGGVEAVTVTLSVGLRPADAPAEATTWFARWVGSVGGSSKRAWKAQAVTSQWYPQLGDFVVVAAADVPVRPLGITVTRPPVRTPVFEDVTAATGVAMTDAGVLDCENYSFGAAWADVEGDGDPDLYVPQRLAPARLWINEGGMFVDRAAAAGVTNADREGVAASFADYDNDGDPDLYVVNGDANRLYRNEGNGSFVDVTAIAGVGDPGPGASAAWGDYDGDGFLDLYVANHTSCNPLTYGTDRLYHNEGDGTFTDRTELLSRSAAMNGAGFQAAWWDFDSDGDPDLYLGNDYYGPTPKPNVLWRNDGPGSGGYEWTFTNVSAQAGMGLSINTMGIGIGDFDRDADLDVALSNIEANHLMRNQGDGTFTDVAGKVGVGRPQQRVGQKSVTWGLVFGDLNLDGWEDLFVPAGSFRQPPEPQPDEIFVAAGDGTFLDLSARSGLADPQPGRGVAVADYDRDGRLDLFVLNRAGEPRLWRNVTSAAKRHWLELDLQGTTSNRDGCGAVLLARLPSGARLLRQVSCGSTSLGSGSWPDVHLGLGRERELATLKITWPSGTVQRLSGLQADRFLTIVEP